MKKLLLLLCSVLLMSHWASAQVVGENIIEDFESTRRITYGYRGGTLTEPLANPQSGGINTSSHVGQYVRNAGIQYDVIVCDLSGPVQNVADYMSGSKKFSMKVFTNAPVGTNVELTVQNAAISLTGYPNGRHSVYSAITTTTGAWETLVFNFAFQPAPGTATTNLDQLIISFNAGTFTGYTYLFDDLAGPSLSAPPVAITKDFLWSNFNTVQNLQYWRGDGRFSRAANPNTTVPTLSDTVGKYVRSTTQYDLVAFRWNAPLNNLSDYRANTRKFSVKVYSPAVGTRVQFTLQDSTAAKANYPTGRFGEFTGVTTTANQWETVVLNWVYTPDGSVADANVNELAILFNAGNFSSTTVYMDSLYGPSFTPPVRVGQNMIDNFEGTRLISYNSMTGSMSVGFSNPTINADNPSTTVGRYIRSGSTLNDKLVGTLSGVITGAADYVSGYKQFSMKLYTTAPVGTPVELTVQNSALAKYTYPVGRHSVYRAVTTVTNAWETLVFTFVNQPSTAVPTQQLDQLVLSFDNNSLNNDTYYFDNLAGPGLVASTLPLTQDYLWTNFNTVDRLKFRGADGSISKIFNFAQGGGSSADSVARYIRSGAQYDVLRYKWDAPLSNLADYRANNRKFSVKVYSPAIGTRIQFTLQDTVASKLGYPNGRFAEFTGVTTTNNQWETVVLDYVNTPDGSVASVNVNELVILFNSNTFSPVTVMMEAIYGPTFVPNVVIGENVMEDFETNRLLNYSIVTGSFTQPLANPFPDASNSSSHVGGYVRNGGVQYDVIVANLKGPVIGINDYVIGNKKFSMKVYTTAPIGTNIDLTFQNASLALGGYPTGRHSVYRAVTTVTNAWETLVFNFDNQPAPGTPGGNLDQMVFSFNNNSFTNASYTFDDLKGAALNVPAAPITNEFLWSNFNTVDWLATKLADGNFSKVANPDMSAPTNSDNVGRYIRSGNQYDVLLFKWDAPLSNLADYRANIRKFRIKVYSPAAGTRIQFTLQDSVRSKFGYPNGRYGEFTGATTKTNEWETVVLDWVNTPDGVTTAASVNELAILFNANTFAPITMHMDSLYGPGFTPPANNWVGVESSDFANANNWFKHKVPGRNDTIFVGASVPNSPLLNHAVNVAGVKISAGASLSIGNTGVLAINSKISNMGTIAGTGEIKLTMPNTTTVGGIPSIGTFTLDGPTRARLLSPINIWNELNVKQGQFDLSDYVVKLKSNSNGTARLAPMGVGASLSRAINFYTERYLDPSKGGPNGAWFYVAAPTVNAPVSTWSYANNYNWATYDASIDSVNSSLWLYDALSTSVRTNRGFVKPTSPSQIIGPGVGARVWFWSNFLNNGTSTTFSRGTPQVGDFTFRNLKYCASGCAYTSDLGGATDNGWNLVGNPYPSNIDWDADDWIRLNVADAIYVFNWSDGNFASYVGGVGVNGGTSVIPSSQAFFIRATAANPQMIATENVKTTATASFLRQGAISNVLKMKLVGANNKADEAALRLLAGATDLLDDQFDAVNMRSDNGVDISTTTIDGKNLMIDARPMPTASAIIPLRLVGVGASITFSGLQSFDAGISLDLLDQTNGQTSPISEGAVVSVLAGHQYAIVVNNQVTGLANNIGRAFSLFPNPATDKVTLSGVLAGTRYNIVNALGQSVMAGTWSDQAISTQSLRTGIYFVQVEGMSTQRLVIE